ncbi:hypothetical protein RND71_037830 [Anisodus tanguticus]|uniref:EXS domain-containing protein n=1 Tax=Anisodus tanguticus TaxID=243964 RepID=A0AAE1QXW9_9SOLA|nr:hypothetical protein RND71_037830 [Anisodus tanguticus]
MDAPANSPQLRKSGRAVVSDFGTFEPDSGFEEALLHSIGVNEMKGVSAPSSTTAIVPSPVLLWRLKISWDSVMRMSVNLHDLFLYEAFLYYNPLLLVTIMVWFWGMNLWVFAQANVDFPKIFDLDQNHLTHREIWKAKLFLICAMVLFVSSRIPFSVSGAPICCFRHGSDISLRYFLFIISLLFAIAFADFFLADILTSMSKVFSDLERSVCRMVHQQVATIAWFEADSVCGSHSVAIPIVLVLPYLCRLFQCLRQYKDTRDRTTLFNALKYSTAVPVIFLSALKYHVFPDNWVNLYRPLWLLSAVVNSLYSFYWDLTRDWDLSCFTRIFKFTRPHILSHVLYGRKWVYFWVIGSNLILRCTWTYKLSAHLRHNYLTVFAITALEIFRRFQWAFFRVENEWNKTSTKSNSQFSMGDVPKEEEKLLNSTGHNV